MVAHTNIYMKANICGMAAQQRIMRRLEQERRHKRRNTEFWAEKHKTAVKTMPNWVELREEETKLYNQRIRSRNMTRALGLAYGFIRGRSYRQMEQTSYSHPHWPTVLTFIASFHKEDPRVWIQRFQGWVAEGKIELPAYQVDGIVAVLAKAGPKPSSLILP